MHDPDVILRVDGHAGDRSEHPVIRQRLGPERIDLERRDLALPRACAATGAGRLPGWLRAWHTSRGPHVVASSLPSEIIRGSLHAGRWLSGRRRRQYTPAKRPPPFSWLPPRGGRRSAAAVLALAISALASAHDIPSERHRSGVREAGGGTAAAARARAARGDARRRVPAARPRLPRSGARAPAAAATPRRSGSPTASRSTRGDTRLGAPRIVADARVAAVGSIVRNVRDGARARDRSAAARPTPTSPGSRRCSTCCSSIRSRPTARLLDRSDARAPRRARRHGAPLPAAGRRRARVRVRRRSGTRAARSALAPGGAAVRALGLRAHPRRHRPPAVPVLPRDSVPPLPPARRSS